MKKEIWIFKDLFCGKNFIYVIKDDPSGRPLLLDGDWNLVVDFIRSAAAESERLEIQFRPPFDALIVKGVYRKYFPLDEDEIEKLGEILSY